MLLPERGDHLMVWPVVHRKQKTAKRGVKKSVSSTSVELPFKGQISNNAPGWSRVSHKVMVDTKGLGPAYLC